VVRKVVTGGSLTGSQKMSLRCLLVEIPWQINEQVPSFMLKVFELLTQVFSLLCAVTIAITFSIILFCFVYKILF